MTFFTGYVGLGTGSASFTEQSGTGYARVAVTLTNLISGSNKHIVNSASATFTASANWTNASTQVGIFETATSANPLLWWNRANPFPALANGNSDVIAAQGLNLFLADVAAAVGQTSSWNAGDVFGTTSSGSIFVGAPVIVSDGVMSMGFPAGCVAKLVGANMNATTDQQFVLNPLLNGSNFIVTKIVATNASVSLTTAAGGVYPAASKGGTALVASSQVYTALTSSSLYTSLTLAATTNTAVYSTAPYLSLTTGQGAAATADLYLFGSQLF